MCPGWPKLLWFVTESKHLSKPPRDWFPHIKDANQDTAYIEVTHTLIEGSTLSGALKHLHWCGSTHYSLVNGNQWCYMTSESRRRRVDISIFQRGSMLSSRPVLPDVPLDGRAVITRGNVCLIEPGIEKAGKGK